jgi:tetratricopeptide (TPR) repeat protein
VSARRRVALLVGAVAIAAVAVVAAAVLSSDGGSAASPSTTTPGLRPGRPPLSLTLGFRSDPEARDLARAQALYARGETKAAARLFARHDSPEAKVGLALADWPDGSLARLEQLAKLYPGVAVVQLHLGLVRLWSNEGDPVAAWRAALEAEPDTPYAVVAGNLLHPDLPRGLPAFLPSFAAPASITSLPAARQLEALRVAAENGGLHEQLLYGVGLQRVGRPVSAARVFERAAHRFPDDVEAQVAGAVGAFDKDAPERAFGRLGPLSATHGDDASVRFHLGVLLLWIGRIKPAERQFRLAVRAQPGSPLAREADRYLETIRRARG